MPESLEEIGFNAFMHNESLIDVTYPSAPRQIGLDDEPLTHVTFPNALKQIGKDSFLGCKSIINVFIPSSVEYVGAYAFMNATKIEELKVDKTFEETSNWDSNWFMALDNRAIATVIYRKA